MTTSSSKVLKLVRPKDKKNQRCVLCSGSKELQSFKKQKVCLSCIEGIRFLYFRGFFNKQ
jgi:hypothetical protein